MREKLREKIKSKTTVAAFAVSVDITTSDMYNFLNGKKELRSDRLEKIITALGLEINEPLPYVMDSCLEFNHDGVHKFIGEEYGGLLLKHVFGYNGSFILLLENEKKELEIRILNKK